MFVKVQSNDSEESSNDSKMIKKLWYKRTNQKEKDNYFRRFITECYQ